MNKKPLGYAALFVAIALLPFLGVYPIFAMKVMCYALFACAFNLLIGFTGLLSFGHAAFLGAAAYAAGHALKVWGFPPLLGIAFGTLMAAVQPVAEAIGRSLATCEVAADHADREVRCSA